jgi:hypothetical protein
MPNTRRRDSVRFLKKVGDALLRIAALGVMGVAHYALEKWLIYVIPENIQGAKPWLQDISFAAFILIYAFLLWDMVKIFVPRLQAKPYPGTIGGKRK